LYGFTKLKVQHTGLMPRLYAKPVRQESGP